MIQHAYKYARIERERRFLLKKLPNNIEPDRSFVRIIDMYIPNTRLRLRRMESPSGEIVALKFTQKFPTDQQPETHTTMTNMYLSLAEYKLLATLGGSKLIKRRYRYDYEGNRYSIDVFEGQLHGLILCEIESQSDEHLASLPVPPFALREVTGERCFTGGELVKLSAAGEVEHGSTEITDKKSRGSRARIDRNHGQEEPGK